MAITSLSASVMLQLSINAAKVDPGLDPTRKDVSQSKTLSFQAGTGAGQIDEAVVMVRTLAAGASETIDLSAALTNVVRDPNIVLARAKVLLVRLLAADETIGDSATGGEVTGTVCSSLTVGAAAPNPWQGPLLDAATDKFKVTNGGFACFGRKDATGWLVGSGANDQLKVQNDDGANVAQYVLALLGVSV